MNNTKVTSIGKKKKDQVTRKKKRKIQNVNTANVTLIA